MLGAEHIKRVHLELGGKSASLVLDDADLALAVRATVDQACFNTGQTCLQWSRLLVPAHRHAEALGLAAQVASQYRVGPPRDPSTDPAPLVARQIRTGQVAITGGPFNMVAPFGGMKQSGIGRECGVEGLDGFCEIKAMQLPDSSAPPTGPRLRDERQATDGQADRAGAG